MFERKNPLTDYGLKVKSAILSSGKSQNWLIEEIKKREPGVYVDSSVLNKVMTGKISKGKLIETINNILFFNDSMSGITPKTYTAFAKHQVHTLLTESDKGDFMSMRKKYRVSYCKAGGIVECRTFETIEAAIKEYIKRITPDGSCWDKDILITTHIEEFDEKEGKYVTLK